MVGAAGVMAGPLGSSEATIDATAGATDGKVGQVCAEVEDDGISAADCASAI